MNNYLVKTLTLGLVAGILLGACGGGGGTAGPGPEPGQAGLLRKVSSADELEAAIKSGFTTIRSSESLDSTVVGSAGSPSIASYSRTYTQEIDVDEFDSVKYDGDYLFVAPMRRQFPCCFIADQPLAGGISAPPVESSIRIFETDPATAAAVQVGAIPLDDDVSVQGLYRTADRLVAMTSRSFFGNYGDAWASFAIWAPEETGIAVYDTVSIADPGLIFEATFDGVFIESRRVGETIYVVSRFTPNVDNLVYNVTTAADQAANDALLAGVALADLLPVITVNGAPQSLVTPENCFVPSDEPPAYPVITSITAIPVGNPAAFSTTCYNDDAYGIYVSPESIYIAQSKADGQATRLHKFVLTGAAPAYAGSGDIDGIVWTGGQADFRLHEKDGQLRAFATKYDGAQDFVDHILYVLREAPAAPALEIVSQLPNDARPEEIGKPNEALYGVRFLDDRVFAVTFEQIDPLYVIDLADTADPRIAGTLDVPGFSDFLHPVTDDLLLGLGSSENNAVKLELFDVSTLSRPLSIGREILGGRGSFSEASYDRHAFTYLADVNGVDRFTIPADLTADDDSFRLVESGLYLYEIHDKLTPSIATLNTAGRVVVKLDNGDALPNYSARSRAVLHNDALYYVRDDDIYSVLWGAPAIVNGPF